jgi:hypothetical protein
MKFKGKPIDIEPYEDGLWSSWFEEILEEDGYVHGYYVDGYIVGDVVDATDEWINLSFWCPVDKDSVEVVK